MTTDTVEQFGDLKPGTWFTVLSIPNLWMMKLSNIVAPVNSVDPAYHSGYPAGSQWNTVDGRGNLWNWSAREWVIPMGRLDDL